LDRSSSADTHKTTATKPTTNTGKRTRLGNKLHTRDARNPLRPFERNRGWNVVQPLNVQHMVPYAQCSVCMITVLLEVKVSSWDSHRLFGLKPSIREVQ
jgi:hypothetical protein